METAITVVKVDERGGHHRFRLEGQVPDIPSQAHLGGLRPEGRYQSRVVHRNDLGLNTYPSPLAAYCLYQGRAPSGSARSDRVQLHTEPIRIASLGQKLL